MAAAFTTTATTLEGQILELVREAQQAELAIPADERPNNVTIAVDFEALQATLTVTIPITMSDTSSGIIVNAGTYLP